MAQEMINRASLATPTLPAKVKVRQSPEGVAEAPAVVVAVAALPIKALATTSVVTDF